tara:strand:+ start:1 stop:855 length:855 start_codon:yes stop_codon:yes gene_type:complete
MFIWLASYPKSGNTLVRALLASYFFTQDGNFDFEFIKNIKQFPTSDLFEKIGVDLKNEKEILKNYIKVQDNINKKNSVQFLKTHSYLFNIDNNPFTNLNNTLGAIYIIRDPRNVVASYAHHFAVSVDDAAHQLVNSINMGGDLTSKKISDRTKVYVGSWGSNFNSWKSLKTPGKYLLIKYEDLINNKKETFLKMLEFIHKLKKVKFVVDNTKLDNSIASTNFKKMQNLEKEKGFIESKINIKTGKNIPFFNLGSNNKWENSLNSEIVKKIENAFEKEMLELGYL